MSTALRLGYVPLTDAAPLILAHELGFARGERLEMELVPARSWAFLRDMLALGRIEAAQMLAPMPVAAAMGLGPGLAAVDALMVLAVGGDVIGLSRALAEDLRGRGYGFDFADPFGAGAALLGRGRLRFGVPFAFSTHAELLWHWLSACGLDGPGAVDVITVPPPRMAEAVAAGEIDAFCVGEPWGSLAVETGAGALLLPGAAIWEAAPEKVLACRRQWAESHPDLTGRLMRAVWRAQAWLDRPENRGTAAEILARHEYLNLPVVIVERALSGRFTVLPSGETRVRTGFIRFHDGAAGFPWRSQAMLFADRIARRLGLDRAAARAAGAACYRTDLYRLHLRGAGADLPGASAKLEGALAHPTAVASERGSLILQPDRFFDGTVFDPETPD